MIAVPARRLSHLNRSTRDAFTLLEVLVVVAILVVLASVASVAVFRHLDEAKEDKATLDMQALEKTYKAAVLKSGGEMNSTNFKMEALIPYIDQGAAALIDPWGQQYNFRFGQSQGGDERIQFYTMTPKGKELVWPRQ
jgi:general secretion pathway protein G